MTRVLLYIAIVISSLLSFTACQKDGNKGGNSANVYNNDFESHFGYTPHVEKGKGHSGECFYAMDSTTEYSLTFMKTFNKLSTNSYAKVKYSTFVLMPDADNSAALTIQIWDGAGNPLKVESKIVKASDVGQNKWVEVSAELSLVGLYAGNHEIRCFVHNPLRQAIYLDDMRVELFQ